LSFRTYQVFFRRILEEASPFFLPLSFFFFEPPKKPKVGTSGDSFQRLSVSLLSKGAHLLGVLGRLSSATL
jgi:hypothetical protein